MSNETVKRVVVIEFQNSEDVPHDGTLSRAVSRGLLQYGYQAESILVLNKNLRLFFPKQNAFVDLSGPQIKESKT